MVFGRLNTLRREGPAKQACLDGSKCEHDRPLSRMRPFPLSQIHKGPVHPQLLHAPPGAQLPHTAGEDFIAPLLQRLHEPACQQHLVDHAAVPRLLLQQSPKGREQPKACQTHVGDQLPHSPQNAAPVRGKDHLLQGEMRCQIVGHAHEICLAIIPLQMRHDTRGRSEFRQAIAKLRLRVPPKMRAVESAISSTHHIQPPRC